MAKPFKIPNLMGEPNCCDTCDHEDCESIRQHARDGCPLCNKQLQKGCDYYYIEHANKTMIAHFDCAWIKYLRFIGVSEKEIKESYL